MVDLGGQLVKINIINTMYTLYSVLIKDETPQRKCDFLAYRAENGVATGEKWNLKRGIVLALKKQQQQQQHRGTPVV